MIELASVGLGIEFYEADAWLPVRDPGARSRQNWQKNRDHLYCIFLRIACSSPVSVMQTTCLLLTKG